MAWKEYYVQAECFEDDSAERHIKVKARSEEEAIRKAEDKLYEEGFARVDIYDVTED